MGRLNTSSRCPATWINLLPGHPRYPGFWPTTAYPHSDLTQTDQQGVQHLLTDTSWKPTHKERDLSPILLELNMAACVTTHFHPILQPWPFTQQISPQSLMAPEAKQWDSSSSSNKSYRISPSCWNTRNLRNSPLTTCSDLNTSKKQTVGFGPSKPSCNMTWQNLEDRFVQEHMDYIFPEDRILWHWCKYPLGENQVAPFTGKFYSKLPWTTLNHSKIPPCFWPTMQPELVHLLIQSQATPVKPSHWIIIHLMEQPSHHSWATGTFFISMISRSDNQSELQYQMSFQTLWSMPSSTIGPAKLASQSSHMSTPCT